MPMTKVYLRKGRTAEQRRAISEAIHRALVEVIGIPDDDRYHVFHELDDDNLISAPVAFGLERRREAVFIQFYFGQRPAEKLRELWELWASVVANLGQLTDLERATSTSTSCRPRRRTGGLTGACSTRRPDTTRAWTRPRSRPARNRHEPPN